VELNVAVATIGTVVFAASACGSSPSKPASSSTTTASTASGATTSLSATASNSPSATTPVSGVSNSQTYAVTPSSTTGQSPDGQHTWTLNVDTIGGGDTKVADAFNTAVKSAAQQQLDTAKPGPSDNPGLTWNFETTPTISFTAGAVSELLEGVAYTQNAAHPSSWVSTVVIDSRSASPITLKDLFADEQKGLDRLSQQTRQLAPGVLGSGPTPMADAPGNAPTEANFAHWLPTTQGIEIHFNDYQLGPHGLVVVTVPWSAVDDLLAPGMTALRQP
jgi:hypothetical protein